MGGKPLQTRIRRHGSRGDLRPCGRHSTLQGLPATAGFVRSARAECLREKTGGQRFPRLGGQRFRLVCRDFVAGFTGATGLEPATSGVTGRNRRNRHSRVRPGIIGHSRHFLAERTGYGRLRPARTRQDVCRTCVVALFTIETTAAFPRPGLTTASGWRTVGSRSIICATVGACHVHCTFVSTTPRPQRSRLFAPGR